MGRWVDGFEQAESKTWCNLTFQCAECNFNPAAVSALRVHTQVVSPSRPGSWYHSAPNQRISEVEARRKIIWPWVNFALQFKHYLTDSSRVHNLDFRHIPCLLGQNSSAHSKGLEQPLFDDSRVHICVPSHLSSELLSVSVCLSAGCLGLSPHLGHLSPRAHQPLIGADRTRYPPTLLHQPSVLPYILWMTSFIISFRYSRTTSWLMRHHSLASLLKSATFVTEHNKQLEGKAHLWRAFPGRLQRLCLGF